MSVVIRPREQLAKPGEEELVRRAGQYRDPRMPTIPSMADAAAQEGHL